MANDPDSQQTENDTGYGAAITGSNPNLSAKAWVAQQPDQIANAVSPVGVFGKQQEEGIEPVYPELAAVGPLASALGETSLVKAAPEILGNEVGSLGSKIRNGEQIKYKDFLKQYPEYAQENSLIPKHFVGGEKGPDLMYITKDAKGNPIGHATFNETADQLIPLDTAVNPEYQRHGIASKMYSNAEKSTGKKIIQPAHYDQSEEAKALWNQPNRPFGGLALGGEVQGYANGGSAGYPPTAPLSTPVDPLQAQNFDMDAWLNQKEIENANTLQQKYGSGLDQAQAFAEGAARGVTFGLSDQALVRSGLSTPERLAGHQQANPGTSLLGTALGGGGVMALTGGLAAPIEGALGAGTAARLLGYGAEGALFGAGNVISDQAMGDPNLNAQKVLSEIGMGAAMGTGLGLFSKAIGAAPALLRRAQGIPEAGVPSVEAATAAATGEPLVEGVPGKAATGLEEMQKLTQEQMKYGGAEDLLNLPQKAEALDAMSRLNDQLNMKITNMQADSLNSAAERSEFKNFHELPGKAGDILRNFQGAQKKELSGVLDNTIKSIAPDYIPTTDAAQAGERAAESFTNVIQGNRDSLGPAFEQIKSTPLNDTDHLPGIIDYLTDTSASKYANPKISNMFETGGDEVSIKPYKTSMGIDRATYRAIKDAVSSLEENPKDFQNLFDVRKGMSQNVDVTKLGDAPKEIGAAKAAMMDYIQDAVQSQDPDLAVRETFKNYAINEQNAQFIEKKLGAEIGSDNFRSLARGQAEENILKKIFRDSETVAAVKRILPEGDFNKLLADHLSIIKNDVTDKGVFSSNKFASTLKRNQYALNEAFSGNAPALQKIKDATTLLRIFADDTPQNPSGTTKTLIQYLLNAGVDPIKHLANLAEFGKGKLGELQTNARINAKLAGISTMDSNLTLIQNTLKKVTDQIDEGTKAIFSERGKNFTRGALLSTATNLSDKAYQDHIDTLQKFSSNPQVMMDHVADNSQDLYQAAPNITQSIHATIMQGVAYLTSKIPKPPATYPLSQPWEATEVQKRQFNQYYNAVNEPIGVLKEVKNGSISNPSMEALNAVHPQLLQEMRQKVVEQLPEHDAANLPYSKKIALSKFLGQPMDQNLTPQGLISNQMALNANLSQQSAPQSGRKSTVGGLKQLKLSSRTKPAGSKNVDDIK